MQTVIHKEDTVHHLHLLAHQTVIIEQALVPIIRALQTLRLADQQTHEAVAQQITEVQVQIVNLLEDIIQELLLALVLGVHLQELHLVVLRLGIMEVDQAHQAVLLHETIAVEVPHQEVQEPLEVVRVLHQEARVLRLEVQTQGLHLVNQVVQVQEPVDNYL